MMTIGGTAHILMLVATIVIIAVLMFICSRVSPKWQSVMIHSAVLIGMVGILFLHLTRRGTAFDPQNFFEQMFQVCNFNFILLPLCLIKKNELGRQYLFFFSMFAAASTFITYPSDVENSMWYSIVTLNFWIDHMMVVLVPMLMIAARRFKPRKEYIVPVLLCMLVYFLASLVANIGFNGWSLDGPHNHSYTLGPGNIMVLEPLYKLCPIPFVYLLLTVPYIGGAFWLLAMAFKKYQVKNYYEPCIEKIGKIKNNSNKN